MKNENQPGYIPHIGPTSPTKPVRPEQKSVLDKIKTLVESGFEHLAEPLLSFAIYKADAILITGREKHSGERMSVFYFGLGMNQAYLSDLLFSEHEASIQAVNVNPWRARAWCKKFQSKVDLVILDVPWPVCKFVNKDGFLALPPWVNMVIPLGQSWESVVSRWAKNAKGEDLRRIRKHQLNFRLLDSKQAFRDFYHQFYVPYLTTRFGAAVFIESEEKIVSTHEYGEIIQITRGETVIAAGILVDTGHSIGYHWTGMPADIDPAMRDGAFAALYYFIVRLAYERGRDDVDCFTSRPFLTDGVLRYKRKWGGRLSGHHPLNGQILLKPMRNNRTVTTFLQQNPLITVVDDCLVARVLFDGSEMSTEQALLLVDTHHTDGLQTLQLYSLHGFAQGAGDAVRERKLPVQLIDLRSVDNPLSVYCRA